MSDNKFVFSDFWYYHKWKIFALIFFIMLVALGITQCSSGKKTDLGILHACETDGVSGTEFVKHIREEVFDDKNNEKEIVFTSIYISPDINKRIEDRSLEQLQIELSAGESTLYIVDSETFYVYSPDGIFEDITDIADKFSIPEDMRYLGENGEVIGISVDSNAYLKETGVFSDSLYVSVRAGDREEYENAYKVLNHILENR